MVTLPSAEQASPAAHGPTRKQQLLSGLAKTVFRLNGQLLAIAEDLAQPVGLTAAWWQVLATVLREPLPVADIARQIGNTRQSVQRVADLLVEHDLADYKQNPAHRRSKLLAPTPRGRDAVRRIRPAHAFLAERVAEQIGTDDLEDTLDDLARLSDVLDEIAIETT